MAIGTGIVLLLLGLILVADVIQVDLGFVDDTALGWILLLGGVVAIVLSLVINQQRTKRTYREEHR